jgi:hypothetical protein
MIVRGRKNAILKWDVFWPADVVFNAKLTSCRYARSVGISPNSNPVARQVAIVKPRTRISNFTSTAAGTPGHQIQNDVSTPVREQDPQDTSRGCKENTLRQHLAGHVPPAGAHRQSNRDLCLAYRRSSQEQVANIGAGNQKQRCDNCHYDVQRLGIPHTEKRYAFIAGFEIESHHVPHRPGNTIVSGFDLRQ